MKHTQGRSNPPPKPTNPSPFTPQSTQTPQKSQPPLNRPNPNPISTRRCFKCQGLGHITADFPNRKVITVPEWKVVQDQEIEKENEEDIEGNLEETLEEIEQEVNKGEMSILRRVLSGQ